VNLFGLIAGQVVSSLLCAGDIYCHRIVLCDRNHLPDALMAEAYHAGRFEMELGREVNAIMKVKFFTKGQPFLFSSVL
jgi:hypothetical protein